MEKIKCECWSLNTTLENITTIDPAKPISINDFENKRDMCVNAVYKMSTYKFTCKDCWLEKEITR